MKSKFFRPFLAIASAIGSLFNKNSSPVPDAPSKNQDRITGERLKKLFENSIFNQSGRPGNIAIRIASRETNQRKIRKNFRRLIAAGAR